MPSALIRLGKTSTVEFDLRFFGNRHHFKFVDLEAWCSLHKGYQYGCVIGFFGLTAQMHVSLFMKPPTED